MPFSLQSLESALCHLAGDVSAPAYAAEIVRTIKDEVHLLCAPDGSDLLRLTRHLDSVRKNRMEGVKQSRSECLTHGVQAGVTCIVCDNTRKYISIHFNTSTICTDISKYQTIFMVTYQFQFVCGVDISEAID